MKNLIQSEKKRINKKTHQKLFISKMEAGPTYTALPLYIPHLFGLNVSQ